jgi:hypothetical protein
MGVVMTGYKFDSIKEFNKWHESVKSILGLPYDDGVTTEYTDPLIQPDGSVIAYSDDEFADNLTKSNYTTPVLEYVTTQSEDIR